MPTGAVLRGGGGLLAFDSGAVLAGEGVTMSHPGVRRRVATASLQGVPPALYRTALYAEDEDGRRISGSKVGCMKVRAGLSGAYSTAHTGSVAGEKRDELADQLRAAGCTVIEAEAFVVSLRVSRMDAAVELQVGLRTYDQRLARARRKLVELAEVVGAMR